MKKSLFEILKTDDLIEFTKRSRGKGSYPNNLDRVIRVLCHFESLKILNTPDTNLSYYRKGRIDKPELAKMIDQCYLKSFSKMSEEEIYSLYKKGWWKDFFIVFDEVVNFPNQYSLSSKILYDIVIKKEYIPIETLIINPRDVFGQLRKDISAKRISDIQAIRSLTYYGYKNPYLSKENVSQLYKDMNHPLAKIASENDIFYFWEDHYTHYDSFLDEEGFSDYVRSNLKDLIQESKLKFRGSQFPEFTVRRINIGDTLFRHTLSKLGIEYRVDKINRYYLGYLFKMYPVLIKEKSFVEDLRSILKLDHPMGEIMELHHQLRKIGHIR